MASGAWLAMADVVLKDARFDVNTVGVSGPTVIPSGGNATYTVSVNITRLVSQSETIIGTRLPPPTPTIRPAIYSSGAQLTYQQIDFLPNENAKTVTLTLSCVNHEVRGSVAGSGHGNPKQPQWWCLWLCTAPDPAPIKGHLNEKESSNTINVLCSS
jgi:hypothetical protein